MDSDMLDNKAVAAVQTLAKLLSGHLALTWKTWHSSELSERRHYHQWRETASAWMTVGKHTGLHGYVRCQQAPLHLLVLHVDCITTQHQVPIVFVRILPNAHLKNHACDHAELSRRTVRQFVVGHSSAPGDVR